MKKERLILISLIAFVAIAGIVFMLSSQKIEIEDVISGAESEKNIDEQEDVSQYDSDQNLIIEALYETIETNDSARLKELISDRELLLMRSILSGNNTRGEDVFEYISYSELPDNLEFSLIKDEYPIRLLDELTLNGDVTAIKQHQTSEKLNIDETSKQEIMELLWRLNEIEVNTEEQSILYLLDDGKMILVNYSGSGLQYSNWVIFDKKDSNYKIILIALIY